MALSEKITFFLFIFSYFEQIFTQYGKKEINNNDIINLKMTRSIDISKNIIKIANEVLIKSNKNDVLSTYRLPLARSENKFRLHLNAYMKSTHEDEQIDLKMQHSNSDADYDYWDLNFYSDPMNFEEERILIIDEHLYGNMQMLPREITLLDNQNSLLNMSLNLISFYATNKMEVKVKLPNMGTKLM
jgi:hypothetical protein